MPERGCPVSLYLAIRAIRRGNRGTLVLTILLIALMVVLMNIMVIILGSVVSDYYQQLVDYQYGHVIIVPKEKQTYIENAGRLTERLERVPGVFGVSSRYTTGVTLASQRTGKSPSASLTAISPEDEMAVSNYHTRIVDGDYLSAGETGQIVIGVLLAGYEDETKDKFESLGGARVGDLVTVSYRNGAEKVYRIKGIYQTDNALNDVSAFVTRTDIESVMPTGGRATTVVVRGDGGSTDPAYAFALKIACLEFGVQEQVKTWQEKGQALITDAMGSIQLIQNLILAVSLVVASVVVFVITFINITNRRKQIAILKAIGIPGRTIVENFLIQTFFLCSCGAFAGWLLLLLLTGILNLFPLKMNTGYVYPSIDYSQFAISILLLYCVGLLSGYLPARKVADEDILEAMRG